jgi:hypothetical protein
MIFTIESFKSCHERLKLDVYRYLRIHVDNLRWFLLVAEVRLDILLHGLDFGMQSVVIGTTGPESFCIFCFVFRNREVPRSLTARTCSA